MITIYLIIFIVSTNGIKTEKHSTNHFIVATSCQRNAVESERILFGSDHQYYFHIFDRTLSSSFSSLSTLSFCKHQQTTYYSSSGFDIFRSSPRFLLTGIVNSQQTSSFHYKNAALSFTNQSVSDSIVKLMSPSENNNNLLADSDFNQLTAAAAAAAAAVETTTTTTTTTVTTTSNSLLSTSTTISNVSLLQTSLSATQQGANRTLNITLLIGCISASIILIIIIICAFVKYRNRDEGSYKIDESKNFVLTPQIDKHDHSSCRGKTSSSQNHRQKLLTTNEQNGVDSREWYV